MTRPPNLNSRPWRLTSGLVLMLGAIALIAEVRSVASVVVGALGCGVGVWVIVKGVFARGQEVVAPRELVSRSSGTLLLLACVSAAGVWAGIVVDRRPLVFMPLYVILITGVLFRWPRWQSPRSGLPQL